MNTHVLHYSACFQKAAAGDLDQNLRALSPEEIEQVKRHEGNLLPKAIALDDPITGNLSSPWSALAGGGALGAAGGAGIGLGVNALLNHFTHGNGDPAHAAVSGAILGAGLGGRTGYYAKKEHNEHIVDKLRQYPEGQATLRRLLTDHYLRNLERFGQTA